MREIPLNRGLVTIVDDADYEMLSAFRWHVCESPYARRNVWIPGAGKSRVEFMHKVILPAPPGHVTDHINRDSLDNRRSNLRIATKSQSVMNRRGWAKSGIRGVHRASPGCWIAQLRYRGTRVLHKAFPTWWEAALAHDEAARLHYGEYAVLNFPNSPDVGASGPTRPQEYGQLALAAHTGGQ